MNHISRLLSFLGGLAAPLSIGLAQTGAALLVAPFEEGQSYEAQVEATIFGGGHTDGAAPNGIDLQMYESQGRARFGQTDDPTGPGKINLGYELLYMNLNSDDAALPGRLVDAQVAAGAVIGDFKDWEVSLVAGVGTASDEPFSDGDSWYPMVDLFFTKQIDDRATLRIGVQHDGNRSIFPDIPLPGFAYTRRLKDDFTFTLGVPYSGIRWTPLKQVTVSVDYWLLYTFDVRVDYQLKEDLMLFAMFDSRYEAFHIDGDDDDRRVFFQQRRVEAGVRWVPCRNGEIVIAGGFAFDQEFERGWDARDTDSVREISDEPYIRLALLIRF